MDDQSERFTSSQIPEGVSKWEDKERALALALRNWVKDDSLFQMDESVSVLFVIAGAIWLFMIYIPGALDSIRVFYGLSVLVIYVGYKCSRVKFSIRLRIFFLAIGLQLIMATALLLAFYLLASSFGLLRAVVEWPSGTSDVLLKGLLRFLMLLPLVGVLVLLNRPGRALGRFGSWTWNHLRKKSEDISDSILTKADQLSKLQGSLHDWAVDGVRYAEVLGLLLAVAVYVVRLASSLGSVWMEALPALVLIFIVLLVYVLWYLLFTREEEVVQAFDRITAEGNKLRE